MARPASSADNNFDIYPLDKLLSEISDDIPSVGFEAMKRRLRSHTGANTRSVLTESQLERVKAPHDIFMELGHVGKPIGFISNLLKNIGRTDLARKLDEYLQGQNKQTGSNTARLRGIQTTPPVRDVRSPIKKKPVPIDIENTPPLDDTVEVIKSLAIDEITNFKPENKEEENTLRTPQTALRTKADSCPDECHSGIGSRTGIATRGSIQWWARKEQVHYTQIREDKTLSHQGSDKDQAILSSQKVPKRITQERRAGETQKECVVCSDNVANVTFKPCGHIIPCFDCSHKIKKCLQCKRKKSQKLNREHVENTKIAQHQVNSMATDTVKRSMEFSRDNHHQIDGETLNILNAKQNSVCCITDTFRRGSGFYVGEKRVLTCFHVITTLAQSEDIILIKNSLKHYRVGFSPHCHYESSIPIADVIGYCPKLDYALVHLEYEPLGVEPIVDYFYSPRHGSRVHLIGYPHNNVKRTLDPNCSVVNVQSLIEEKREKFERLTGMEKEVVLDPNFVHYQCSFFYGSSGCPVFDDYGRLVAIHKGGTRDPEHHPEPGYIERPHGKSFLTEYGVDIMAIVKDAQSFFPNIMC